MIPRMSSSSKRVVAVLYQAIDPPFINGVRKPQKPGGYQDSGADIAYVLQQNGTEIVTPEAHPAPQNHKGWCFRDTEQGIIAAIEKGATHLWANTILFADHPLQTSSILTKHISNVRVVGQSPRLVERFDDKDYVNSLLRDDGSFDLPRSWIVDSSDVSSLQLTYPIVGKPIRGRGSHGVKVCKDARELSDHLNIILAESPLVMLEEFLAGQEATVTVVPPSNIRPYYWCLPVVVRFNHEDGIAPYNGVVAVTANSKVPPEEELAEESYVELCKQCARVAEKLNATAPIRIDARRYAHDSSSRFALFDVNMKPNMTGPGRPGREDQASLTAIAAARMGWTYPVLLKNVLQTAKTLKELREIG